MHNDYNKNYQNLPKKCFKLLIQFVISQKSFEIKNKQPVYVNGYIRRTP